MAEWYGQGFDPEAYKKERAAGGTGTGGGRDQYNQDRFFIKEGEEKHGIFLTDLKDGYKITEHMLWDNSEGRPYYMPCLRRCAHPGKCFPCEHNSYSVPNLGLTLIDREGYVIKKGEKAGQIVKNVKKLFMIPSKYIELFMRKAQDAKGLRCKEFKIFRSSKQDSRLGNDWTFTHEITAEEFTREKIDTTPIDYLKIVPVMTYISQQEFIDAHPGIVFKENEKAVQPPSDATEHTSAPPASAPSAATGAPPPPSDDDVPYEQGAEHEAGYPPF